jgi:3-hydroxyisobutyrate dehydrogenase-like beta-hydroxyacid dehydrogenase
VLDSDVDLADQCSVILSVVPPKDAEKTAQRIMDALVGVRERTSGQPLYFADLNAVAPSTARNIATQIERSRAPIRFIDGGIIGGPPALKKEGSAATATNDVQGDGEAEAVRSPNWKVPSLPTSGPHKLSDIPSYGPKLFDVLNMRHISPEIGAASGLKMCYSSTQKGYTSIAIQSLTTAHRLGVLSELQAELQASSAELWRRTESMITTMPPKAYRFVAEMEEIATTFEEEGGFARDSFSGAAKTYKAVEESELGAEKIGKRKRGLTVEDMAVALAEGIDKRRKKTE